MDSVDEKVTDLINKIESTNDVEKRLSFIGSLQSELEGCDKDDQLHISTYDSISNLLKSLLKNPHQSIFTSSLSLLSVYSPLASTSTHHSHNLKSLVSNSMLLALEKLGDGKERVRELARKALVELGSSAYVASNGIGMSNSTSLSKGKEVETPLAIYERFLRDNGLGAKSPRIKEQASSLLALLRSQTPKFPIRPFLPQLVDLLSDADSSVRDSARLSTIRLFKNPNVTSSAKSDLKKEMEKKGTRKQTAEAILKEVLGGGDLTELDDTNGNGNGKAPLPAVGTSSMGTSEDDVSPVYVASRSDLDRTFASMLPFFEGKETEHNWLNRESSIIKIRGMLATNAHEQFSSNFTAGIKSMQEGIVKTLISLRTTLANHTIFLLAELARKVGDDLDTSAEVFFSALLKMAGYTKKIVATGSQHSAGEFLSHLGFRHHFLYLVSQGFLEKNTSIRIFMCDHLNTILKVHGSKKHQLESHDGLQTIETSLKKGLNDPNPEVRSKSREAFFKFEGIWRDSANRIFEGLDMNIKKQVNSARTLLEKNGDSGAGVALSKSTPSASTSTATAAPRRPGGPSAAIMAAKRAASQKIAKEKKEREEEEEREREAAFEEINERQKNLNLNSTQSQVSTPIAPSITRRPRPVSVISPRSTLREASTVPLPGSSPSNHSSSIHQRTSSASGLPVRTRTSSSGSQSTAGSQSGTPRQTSSSSTTAGSSSSRVHLRNPSGSSTPSHIPRARTTSTSSSTGSASARSGGATTASTGKHSSSSRRPPVSSSSHANKAYQLRSPDSVAADDTLQFPTEDASMDLMAFSSPLKGKGFMDQSIISDVSFGNDNSVSADETARFPRSSEDPAEAEEKIARIAEDAKKAVAEIERSSNERSQTDEPNPSTPKMTSSGLPGTNGISSNRSPNTQTQTPNSTQRRSGLPRPVSMLHRGPSPLHHYSHEISSPSNASRHTPARSLDAISLLNSTSQQKHRNASGSSDVSAISNDGPLPTLSASSSMTSVAGSSFGTMASQFNHHPTSSKASNLWFLNRSSRLDSPSDSTSSPIKSKPESKEWIESLKNGTADLKVFRRLAKLSSEFKLPVLNSSMTDDEMVLQPGRLNGGREKMNGGGALGLQKMGEDELTRDDEERAIDAWTEGNLFVRIFDGLNVFLDGKDQAEDLKSAALVLLNRLVDHQYALFVSSSKESDLLSLLIRLNKSSTKSKLIQKGCDTILDAWSSRSNPILGFGRMVDCLKDGLESLPRLDSKVEERERKELESQRVRVFTLGLRGLGNLLSRLPMELVEEELPRASDLIRTAFNDSNADLRQMAVITICSAHKQLNDSKKLFELIGPLDQQQENLLTYYFAKPLKN